MSVALGEISERGEINERMQDSQPHKPHKPFLRFYSPGSCSKAAFIFTLLLAAATANLTASTKRPLARRRSCDGNGVNHTQGSASLVSSRGFSRENTAPLSSAAHSVLKQRACVIEWRHQG